MQQSHLVCYSLLIGVIPLRLGIKIDLGENVWEMRIPSLFFTPLDLPYSWHFFL